MSVFGSYLLYGDVIALSSVAYENNIEDISYSVVVRPEGTTEPEDFYVFPFTRNKIGNTVVLRYDTDTGSLKKDLGYSLKSGDKVFVATYGLESEFIVVFE